MTLPASLPPSLAALTATSAAVRRQFLPTVEDVVDGIGEHADPIGDLAHSRVPGVVHRYPDRVLLLPVRVCAAYCRFCFRNQTVGPGGGALTPDEIDGALAYIADRPAIREVILSGGDPLVMAPRRLGGLIDRIADLPHVDIVRLHTRLPVVAPERVSPALVAACARGLVGDRAGVWVAVHVNHADELTPAVKRAIAALRDAGLALVAQTVLLRGVNDEAETLRQLFRALTRLGVKPYYLHHPDLAPGTAPFRVPLSRGRALYAELERTLSGLSRPAYVLDIPGGHGKVPVGPCHAVAAAADGDEAWQLTDHRGEIHRYPPPAAPLA